MRKNYITWAPFLNLLETRKGSFRYYFGHPTRKMREINY